MGRKLWLWLLALLVLYVIFQDPSDAGRTASAFFSWLGDGFATFFDFLGELFNGDEAAAPVGSLSVGAMAA